MVMLLSIDVGLVNLGMALVEATHEGLRCHLAERVDITEFRCRHDGGCRCPLHHEAVPVDWVAHLFVSHERAFTQADVVLIERQPPGGFRCVEQLLYQACREKAVLVHPRSFQAHFGVGGLEYDERKRHLVYTARRLYRGSEVAAAALAAQRAHDVADALLFAAYHAAKPDVKRALLPPHRKRVLEDADAHFRRFRYRKSRRLDP